MKERHLTALGYHREARQIAARLAALPRMESIDDYAPHVLSIMRGVDYRIFHLLDEQPHCFNCMADRFYMLRSVRNHPTHGRAMFESLTG